MNFIKKLFQKSNKNNYIYFEIFEAIFLACPEVFFWIKPFPGKKGRYILTYFQQDFFIKYNGLEIVIFDSHQMTYHRLPGALPNGKGDVSLGKHAISVNSMNDPEKVYIAIEKFQRLDIRISDIRFHPDNDVVYQHIETRSLNYDIFVAELIENSLYGLLHFYNSPNCIKDWPKIYKSIMHNDIDERLKMFAQRINTRNGVN